MINLDLVFFYHARMFTTVRTLTHTHTHAHTVIVNCAIDRLTTFMLRSHGLSGQ